MENIATPLPANTANANVIGRVTHALSATDKALFDAFLAVESVAPDAKKKAQPDDALAEKSALASDKPAARAAEPAMKDDSPRPLVKKAGAGNAQAAKAPHPAQDNNKDCADVETNADDDALVTAEYKPLAVVLAAALKDPAVLGKLKKLLNLDDSASAEDVLKACLPHLQKIAAFAQKPQAADGPESAEAASALAETTPTGVADLLVEAIGSLVSAQQLKLSEAERKLRDGLLALTAIGNGASDDAVDAALARNLDAVDAWKAAVAAAKGGDEAIATETPQPADKTNSDSSAPHPLATGQGGEGRAETVATGGRSDANLMNNQASAGQTLPLLPTQLTGGQQRLPVATQNTLAQSTLGGNNLDVIARPLMAAAGDAATKLAKAAARQPVNLPQVYEQVSIRLNRMAKNGDKSMTIQLNPAELGRVEVKLEFAKDATVTARIMADNQQTLDLLQRDNKALERALTDAGLKIDNNSLQFDLRQGGDGQASGFGEAFKERPVWQQPSADKPLVAEEIIINVSPAALVADGRVDIQV